MALAKAVPSMMDSFQDKQRNFSDTSHSFKGFSSKVKTIQDNFPLYEFYLIISIVLNHTHRMVFRGQVIVGHF